MIESIKFVVIDTLKKEVSVIDVPKEILPKDNEIIVAKNYYVHYLMPQATNEDNIVLMYYNLIKHAIEEKDNGEK